MWRWVASAAAVLVACTRAPGSGEPQIAHRLVEGPGQALLAAPVGGAAAYLRAPVHPEGPLMPPDAFLGDLTLVGPDGRTRDLGGGATNLAGAVLFSPDGRWIAWLRHFDFASHRGDLAVAQVSEGTPTELAPAVAFIGFSPDGGWLGYVAGDKFSLRDLVSGTTREVGDGVATFEFSADSRVVLYRRRAGDGGELVLEPVSGRGRAETVARRVADYRFDARGESIAYTLEPPDRLPELHLWKGGVERLLGTSATSFEFSPDGRTLAYVAGVSAHYLEGDVFAVAANGGRPQLVGKRAGAYRFSADGRLAFLHDYYDQARSGKLAVWTPEGGAVEVAPAVTLFGWSHQGAWLAWIRTVTRPLYTEQLFLAPSARPTEARFIGQAIYSFDFSPDDRRLLFKTLCIAGGNACDLMAVSTSAPANPSAAPDGGLLPEKAVRVAAGISDYDFSPGRNWLWLAFMEPIGHVVDLAVIPAQGWSLPRYVFHGAEPHPRWLPTGQLAFLVNNPKQAGFYEVDPAAVPATRVSGH